MLRRTEDKEVLDYLLRHPKTSNTVLCKRFHIGARRAGRLIRRAKEGEGWISDDDEPKKRVVIKADPNSSAPSTELLSETTSLLHALTESTDSEAQLQRLVFTTSERRYNTNTWPLREEEIIPSKGNYVDRTLEEGIGSEFVEQPKVCSVLSRVLAQEHAMEPSGEQEEIELEVQRQWRSLYSKDAIVPPLPHELLQTVTKQSEEFLHYLLAYLFKLDPNDKEKGGNSRKRKRQDSSAANKKRVVIIASDTKEETSPKAKPVRKRGARRETSAHNWKTILGLAETTLKVHPEVLERSRARLTRMYGNGMILQDIRGRCVRCSIEDVINNRYNMCRNCMQADKGKELGSETPIAPPSATSKKRETSDDSDSSSDNRSGTSGSADNSSSDSSD